jgi:hypothetical protein
LRTAPSDRNGGSAEFFNGLYGTIESGAGHGRKIYLCRFYQSEDSLTAGLEDFFSGKAIYLTIKMTVICSDYVLF